MTCLECGHHWPPCPETGYDADGYCSAACEQAVMDRGRAVAVYFRCEFEGCTDTFDTLPDHHLSELGCFCPKHEKWMEKHHSVERDKTRRGYA